MQARPPSRIFDVASPDVVDEYQSMLRLADRLEAAADVAALREVLRHLHAEFVCHLAQEERRDGVFDWVVALAPALRSRVWALRQEHEALRRSLARLGPHDQATDLEGARAFARDLRRHEWSELQLVRQALDVPPVAEA